jgi:hypothetical protein
MGDQLAVPLKEFDAEKPRYLCAAGRIPGSSLYKPTLFKKEGNYNYNNQVKATFDCRPCQAVAHKAL